MEQPRYLIDTNVLIDYLGKKLPDSGMNFISQVIDSVPCISIISKIEVLGFPTSAEHYQTLTEFISDCYIFNLTDDIVATTINIRKSYKIKLPDAIIAATAITCKSILITRNTEDFKNISELKTIDPHKLS